MKLPGDLGRKESIAGIAAVLILSVVYGCLLSYVIRGSVLPEINSLTGSVADSVMWLLFMVVGVQAAILTIRPLFRLYLKIRAYHVKKGSEWQNWRERGKGDNDNA